MRSAALAPTATGTGALHAGTSLGRLAGRTPSGTAPPGSLGRWIERWLSFAVPLVVAVPAAWRLVFHYHSIYNDALDRLANGYYVFYSRDPHLAAIGFVWNPLPSVVDMPLLLFKGVWPALANEGFAANLMSCLFFALSCQQLYKGFEELGVARVARWGLLLCFAANPMIFYYGINGQSEMLFILGLIVTARYLGRWLRSSRTRDLVVSGSMLGVTYLARNEAAAAAVAAGLLVTVVQWRRSEGSPGQRRSETFVSALLFLLPVAASMAWWAVTSWAIVGHPFEQLSSAYGNSSQIVHNGFGIAHSASARLKYAVLGTQSYAPALVPAAALALYAARRRADLRVLAPLAVLGGVLGFEILAYTDHMIFQWYRYYIYAVPLMVMVCGCLAAGTKREAHQLRWNTAMHPRPVLLTAIVALGLAAPGLVTTAHTLGTPGYNKIAASDRAQWVYFLWPHSRDAAPPQYPASTPGTPAETDLAVKAFTSHLDAMHLPNGSVMVDNFTPCIAAMILDSRHPRQFVIPNDEDYESKLGVPYQFGIRYFLVPDPRSLDGFINKLNSQYPNLYDTGQQLATMAEQVNLPGCPNARLYRLVRQFG